MSDELLRSIQSPQDLKRLDVDDLPELASQVRRCICDQIARTGGHFASNLCVVELTLALHYVFDFATDRLIWDVGHQCYPHKLITGRQDLFPKLKQRDGMAGFPDPRESDYDLFAVGHAGSSISTAVGMARGDAMVGEAHRKAVAVIGDASIVNGLAMEGLNNAGTLNRQFLVVLNDNGMAIGSPQGAMAQYFDRVRVSQTLGDIKKRARTVLERIPGGSIVEEIYHRGGDMLRAAIATDHLFEHFGLVCVGPIDGHDILTLVDMFNEVRDIDRPLLVHAKTIKGKGFELAECDPFTFHAPKPAAFVQQNLQVSDCKVEKKMPGRSFTQAFSDAMIDLMSRDEKVYAITAAMPDGTGLDMVMPHFPDRTLDTGLCEGHGMAMAAGLAKSGVKPFYAVYSTFSQRALDQTFQEVALQGLPVRICMDRAGYVGGDGAPMHGFMDITMNRTFPNAAILAACDEPSLRAGLEFMRQYESGPSFIRYPRDKVPTEPVRHEAPPFELGKAVCIKDAAGDRPDAAILGYGIMVYHALAAARELERQGYDLAVYDARFAKPVDAELVQELVEAELPVITIEDHSLIGGFGAAVLEAANARRLDTRLIHRIGMPDRWVYHGTRDEQLEETGLDVPGITRSIRRILEEQIAPALPTHVGVSAETSDATR